ncbi:MAG TPA: ABC transporter substrate-binding protein, partial [Candidatus Caccocola faecipullorum]|nr:ABC transporter substrate-binding protein [Candidatus Caccocola faecipullorum]
KKINYIPVVTGLKIDNPALDTSHVKLLSVGAEHKGDKRKEYVDRWVNEVIR